MQKVRYHYSYTCVYVHIYGCCVPYNKVVHSQRWWTICMDITVSRSVVTCGRYSVRWIDGKRRVDVFCYWILDVGILILSTDIFIT